jgi:hypothetical protein
MTTIPCGTKLQERPPLELKPSFELLLRSTSKAEKIELFQKPSNFEAAPDRHAEPPNQSFGKIQKR